MILTFVFGIVPATVMVLFALIAGAAGVHALFQPAVSSVWRALAMVPFSLMAVAGYVALFYAAGRILTAKVALGLAAGVIANLYGLHILRVDLELGASDEWHLYVLPLIVGCAHLAGFIIGRARRRISRRGA